MCKLPPEALESIKTLKAEGFACTTISESLRAVDLTIAAAVIANHFRRCTANEQPHR